VSGDTGPLHFAAGLGVPTVALFGPSSAAQWRPLGRGHQVLDSGLCACGGDAPVCQSATHCLAAISPEQVLERLRLVLNPQKDCFPGKTGENVLRTA
jgi:ADP-heptose:LPS heptosyltransferase